MTATPLSTPPQSPIGRIPVIDVTPLVDGGARPTKCVVGEEFLVSAKVLREGHDAVDASAVLTDPDGVDHYFADGLQQPRLNVWEATCRADRPGLWTFRVEGWSDPYGTWVHDATIKIQADVDAELMFAEGAQRPRARRRVRAGARAADAP